MVRVVPTERSLSRLHTPRSYRGFDQRTDELQQRSREAVEFSVSARGTVTRSPIGCWCDCMHARRQQTIVNSNIFAFKPFTSTIRARAHTLSQPTSIEMYRVSGPAIVTEHCCSVEERSSNTPSAIIVIPRTSKQNKAKGHSVIFICKT